MHVLAQFTFQYGDFYNETSNWISLLGSLLGGLASGLFALWIYTNGERRRAQEEVNRLRDMKIYFEVCLTSFKEPLTQFRNDLKKFADYYEGHQYGLMELSMHVGLNSNRISEVSTKDLFKIYIQDLRMDTNVYERVLFSIDLIPSLKSQATSIFETLRTYYEDDSDKPGEYLNLTFEYLLKFLTSKSSLISQHSGLKNIADVLDEWIDRSKNPQNHKDGDVFNYLEIDQIILDRLYNTVIDNIKDFPDLEFAIKNIKEFRFQIAKIRNYRRSAADYARITVNSLEKVIDDIDRFLKAANPK